MISIIIYLKNDHVFIKQKAGSKIYESSKKALERNSIPWMEDDNGNIRIPTFYKNKASKDILEPLMEEFNKV